MLRRAPGNGRGWRIGARVSEVSRRRRKFALSLRDRTARRANNVDWFLQVDRANDVGESYFHRREVGGELVYRMA